MGHGPGRRYAASEGGEAMSREKELLAIHDKFVCSLPSQAVDLIGDYGTYDFWADYKAFLCLHYDTVEPRWEAFTRAAILFSRIPGRSKS